MKIVIQRVKKAELYVDNTLISEIGKGLCVYVGFEANDTIEILIKYARKVANMRIFEDASQKMNLSVKNIDGEILLISQFTLLGNCEKGLRPDFTKAEAPDVAKNLFNLFGKLVEENGINSKYGVFGANMQIHQINDGPVTIIM